MQQRFQPELDAYVAARIDEQELFRATDWQRRWYWDFDAYAPIFRICRENGAKLLAPNPNPSPDPDPNPNPSPSPDQA